jgi:hypothetical protein
VFSVIAITGIATAALAAESAQATAGFLKMNVSANCVDGNAFFRVKNVGEDWPKTSTFAIYNMRKKSRKLISKRRMRLKDGQRASFKIKTAKLPTARLGLWVKPGWYKRPFIYDATIKCS